MVTEYYCKSCDKHFTEPALPNMNKVHYCGNLARVTGHEVHQEGKGSESDSG